MPTLISSKREAPQAGAALKTGHCCHVQMLGGLQDEVRDMGGQLLHSTEVWQDKAQGRKLLQPHECPPKSHGLRGDPTQVQKSQPRKTLAAHETKCGKAKQSEDKRQGQECMAYLEILWDVCRGLSGEGLTNQAEVGQSTQAAQAWAKVDAPKEQAFQRSQFGQGQHCVACD